MYPSTYRKTFDDLPVEIQKEIVDITEELLRLQIEERVQKQSLYRTRLVSDAAHQQEKKETILRKLCRNNVWKVKKQQSEGPLVLRYAK